MIRKVAHHEMCVLILFTGEHSIVEIVLLLMSKRIPVANQFKRLISTLVEFMALLITHRRETKMSLFSF